jgi:hypothetical protein
VKNTPFCSCPSTEIRLRAGLAGSESKRKPGCSEDHWIVALVSRNEPWKLCPVLWICAAETIPFHSTSKETVARVGKTGGIGGYGKPRSPGSPNPCVNELAKS